MKEPERLIRKYYADHGITHGTTLLFSYVRKSTTGGDWAIVEYYAAKYGKLKGGKGKDIVTKLVMRFNPETHRYSMSDSVVRYESYSSAGISHLIYDFSREIAGCRRYPVEIGEGRMWSHGSWEHEVMPTGEIPLNDFSGTKYQYCKYRYKDAGISESRIHSYAFWARNPYGSLPDYLRKFDINPRAMEMFASRGLVKYMEDSFLLRLRDDAEFAKWYKRHALEMLGEPIRAIEARFRREMGESCYGTCRREERRLARISARRREVRHMRRMEREEIARRIEAEKREKRERKSRAMRILNLYRKLKSICGEYGAYEVRVPKTEREMRSEGKMMHNCIGSCYPARQGINAIVLFLYRNGKPCVDVEIDPETFEVVQCRKKCNKDAGKKAWRIAETIAANIMGICRKAA